jgi:hypothetical protein
MKQETAPAPDPQIGQIATRALLENNGWEPLHALWIADWRVYRKQLPGGHPQYCTTVGHIVTALTTQPPIG